MYSTNYGNEETEPFLLLCPSFAKQRKDLLTEAFPLLRPYGYTILK